MAVESGKNGTAKIGSTALVDITHWTLEKSVATTRYASNSTAGYKATVAGVRMASGTIDGKWDGSAVSTIIDGTSASLLLYLNATEFYTVPAIISKFSITVDIDNGSVTGFSASFESNGAWTEPTLT